jgi:FdhD protein
MRPLDFPKPSLLVPCAGHGPSALTSRTRALPEETPVALVYDGSTEAVMMATPADLEDFAFGFSLTEGLIESPAEIGELAVLHNEHGIELRMWLRGWRANAYRVRRRRLTGPTGCGLCGIESLAEANRRTRRVGEGRTWEPAEVAAALAALCDLQALHRETHATHAAAFYRPGDGAVLVREDVGRHNALDKLAGILLRRSIDASEGAIVLTSRVSVEMVQKAAAIGAPVVVAISAPTALAVRTAEAANITLIAVARGDSWELFSHHRRIRIEERQQRQP